MNKDNNNSPQNKAVTRALSSVGTTVEAFADRMKRKLKEQKTQEHQSKEASDVRHSLILQTLTTIRKALQETAKIDLGDRFHFELEVTDWEGWPRLDLNLIDGINPDVISYALIVTAHDRNDIGLVQLNLKSGECAGRVMLKDPSEFDKLPVVLKRAIRRFLDAVTPHILDPVASSGARPNKEAEVIAHVNEDVSTNKALAKADLFAEDEVSGENVVEVTDVRPIEGV